MRSPEHRKPYNSAGAGRHHVEQLSVKYLEPGAFTVLPPENDPPPDPPLAPQPYRLTPSGRRHKNMSFAILAEPGSRSGSRSPSPTGRVSPFRGRGFNPAGSRHVSPTPSPPPGERPSSHTNSPHRSKIPKLTRRGSVSIFGEKVEDFRSSSKQLSSQLSQSLTNIAPKKVSSRPPPSPRKHQGYTKAPAFQRLSPIVGSSPEPSQSQSSPAKSRSQPPSRFSSPNRGGRPSSRSTSRPTSKPASRNTSRESSPCKNPTSPTRAPAKNHYRNIQAKVNSFHRPKPKVPPKPQVISDKTDTSSEDNLNNNIGRSKLQKRESFNKFRTNSKTNVIPKSVENSSHRNTSVKNNNNSSNNSVISNNNSTRKTNNSNSNDASNENKGTNGVKETDSREAKDHGGNRVKNGADESEGGNSKTADSAVGVLSKSESLASMLQPSTTAVVSSTTTTVTQPLKIDAKIDNSVVTGNPFKVEAPATAGNLSKGETTASSTTLGGRSTDKTISPMVDGRVLSATSVSNAMNKMNDSVLDTQTLMKDHGAPKLSPAASTIIAMSNEIKNTSPALDGDNVTGASTGGGVPPTRTVTTNNNNNHVTTTGIVPARVLEQHVQNNMSKLISPESVHGNSVQKTANDRMKEARTLVADDVRPIKIMVKEKPMDIEVQSGNVRMAGDMANGLNERPGLPPGNNQTNNDARPPAETQERPKQNAFSRFFTTCKNKMSFNRTNKQQDEIHKSTGKEGAYTGCLCCKKKKPEVTINIEEDEPKQGCWDRVKCCGKNRVRDTQRFPTGRRKDSWVERSDSILSDPQEKTSRCSKANCTNIFRKIFCLDCCCKSKKTIAQDKASRRASMMSKKKSLTPSVPQEDNTPKLDMSLVEHSSHMKGAIPVLPVSLAWFCLVMNCIAPGTGTIFSGMFCLCFGIPRFSQKDGAKQRIGAFIIDLIIGIGQFFTVLFCLVGWGWSIWWGVTMLKIAKRHQKIKNLEAQLQKTEQIARQQVPVVAQNHHGRDPERGS